MIGSSNAVCEDSSPELSWNSQLDKKKMCYTFGSQSKTLQNCGSGPWKHKIRKKRKQWIFWAICILFFESLLYVMDVLRIFFHIL